jgi:AcrR family transcriptional regulator
MDQGQSLREAQKQFTHDRLLEAAVKEFSARGYGATTIDHIASHAGATRATFYLHFRGKADVIAELLEREFRPRWDLLRDLPPRPSRSRIREWLVTTTEAWETHRELISVIYQGIAAEPELAARQAERSRDNLTVFIRAIQHMGWEDELHLRIEAILLLAQLERVFTYWNFEDVTTGRDLVLDLLTENWWSAFQRAKNPGAA